MPRITAPTVREHVARQERAILDAAAELFASRGVAGTDLADIASAVGLARSSLYRYFPDKDHILAAWLSREIQPVLAEVERVEAEERPAIERIEAWIRANLEWVGRSGGEVLPRLLQQVGAVSTEVRDAIAEGEARLREPLRRLVSEAVLEADGRPAPAPEAEATGNGNGEAGHPYDLDERRDPTLIADLLLGAVDAGIAAVGRGATVTVVCDALGDVTRSLVTAPTVAAR